MSVKQQCQQKNDNKKAKQDVPRSHPPVILKPGTRHHNTHPLRHHDACAAKKKSRAVAIHTTPITPIKQKDSCEPMKEAYHFPKYPKFQDGNAASIVPS
jgi:hypothetical protein